MDETQTTNTQETQQTPMGHQTHAAQAPARHEQPAQIRHENIGSARDPNAIRHDGKDPNTIYIGKKGVMGYVLAVVTQFNNTGTSEVKIKARGNMISRAVDVAEIVRHRFLTSASVKGIAISTEELLSEDGTKSKVSSIEITLVK